jgi:hypothetical protein
MVLLCLAAWLLAACSPVVAPVQFARPAVLEARAAWSADQAEVNLRAALVRRGYAPAIADDTAMPVTFDPARVWQRMDGGQIETLAGPGAWLLLSDIGRFWVFESGVVMPAAD